MSPITPEQFRENGRKPFRVTDRDRVYIGDDEFPYPIRKGSIRVEKAGPAHNAVTMTVLVGPVSMATRPAARSVVVVAETIPDAQKLADVLDLGDTLLTSPQSIRGGSLRGIAQVSAIYISCAASLSADEAAQIALLASVASAPLYEVDASGPKPIDGFRSVPQGLVPDVLIMDEPYATEAQP